MLEFALEWWAGILAAIYILGGWAINHDANKAMWNIEAYYNSLDHTSEENRARHDRSKSEVQTNKNLRYIHMLLGIAVFLLAGILVTLIKSSA
jgi:hypothetical protein